jgi:hypothetical protein
LPRVAFAFSWSLSQRSNFEFRVKKRGEPRITASKIPCRRRADGAHLMILSAFVFDAKPGLGKTAVARKKGRSPRADDRSRPGKGEAMRRRPIHAAIVAGTLCIGVGDAHAQSAAQLAAMESKFAAADKDGDGKLTPEEAKAGMPRVSANFTKIDKGSKGFVTVEDIKDAMAAMGK